MTPPTLDLAYSRVFDLMLDATRATLLSSSRLTAFWPQVGCEYQRGGTLFVGKSPDGWPCEKPFAHLTSDDVRDDPSSGECLMDWLDGHSRLNKPFFGAVRKSLGLETASRFWRSIAWSNLYKIAPAKKFGDGRSANPSVAEMEAQWGGDEDAFPCELLRMEIEQLAPAVVVVFGGNFLGDFCDGGVFDVTYAEVDAVRKRHEILMTTCGAVPAILAPHPERKPASMVQRVHEELCKLGLARSTSTG